MKPKQEKRKPTFLLVVVIVSATFTLVGFLFVFRYFGFWPAAIITGITSLPLIISLRLITQPRDIRIRELVFIAILFCTTAGGSVFVVHDWFSKGIHEDYAEDVKWRHFERQLSRDPAFQDVVLHESLRKNVHWASGTVDTEADLLRLHMIAAECGIDRRLDGPFVHSTSLSVRPKKMIYFD